MSRGHDRERDVCKLLTRHGWQTVRAAGSLGAIDVVAASAGTVTLHPRYAGRLDIPPIHFDGIRPGLLFIEVKSTDAGPWATFGPKDRQDLIDAAKRAGADAWLAWWPPQASKPTWISSRDFPKPGKRTRRERATRRRPGRAVGT